MVEAPVLEVDGLTMRFGGLTALDGLDLAVRPGTIHAVIGPNGAGKSTFFNCVSRFYQPSAGRITVGGADILGLSSPAIARLGIARTFQNLELFGRLSVRDNVRLGMHARRRRGLGIVASRRQRALQRQETEEADAIMERLGLLPHADRPAAQLDFGAQKLIELARALAVRPRLLLLDEPAAGLRTGAIEAMDRLLVELARGQGMTIVLVEHVMALVMSISDRITVLNFGRKIAEGTPAEIRNDPGVMEAYLGRRKHA